MASALIIEDGSGVEGANSYATVAQARTYAASRGRAFPATGANGDESAADTLLLNAMDALEARASEFQGTKTTRNQACQWPRYGVVAEGYEYDSNEIPPNIVKAQILLAIESQTQPLVLNTTEAGRLTRMKVEGAVELQYADEEAQQPSFPLVEALLAPFFGDGVDGTFGGFETERV